MISSELNSNDASRTSTDVLGGSGIVCWGAAGRTLTLAAVSTYPNSVIVTAGTVQSTTTSATTAGTMEVRTGATFERAGATSCTFNGTVLLAGGTFTHAPTGGANPFLTQQGLVTLSEASTISCPNTLSAVTLNSGLAGAGNLALVLNTTATNGVNVRAGAGYTGNVTLSGTGGSLGCSSTGGSAFALSNLNLNGANVIFRINGMFAQAGVASTIGALSGSGQVILGGFTLTLGNTSVAGSHSGVISGTGGITKVGTAAQTFSGLNTYTGATAVNAGTLTSVDAVNTTATSVAVGATYERCNTQLGFANRKNAAGTLTGAGIFDVNRNFGAATSWMGLTGTVSLTGNINVVQGVLHNDNLTANWALCNANLSVSAGAEFHTRGQPIFVGGLDGAGTVGNDNTGTTTLITVGAANKSGSFSGVIRGANTSAVDGNIDTGTVALTKIGVGRQTLTGTNVYAGATTITAGQLRLGNGAGTNQVLPVGAAITNNATLEFDAAGPAAHSGIISGTGGIINIGGTFTLTGANTFTGTVNVNGGTLVESIGIVGGGVPHASATAVAAGATYERANPNAGFANRVRYGAALSGAGTFAVNSTTGSTTGAVGLTGTVSLTGTINIVKGILHNDALSAVWTATTADMNVAAGAEFHSRGQATTIGGLNGAGTVCNDNTSATAVVTVGSGNKSGSFSGVIRGANTSAVDGNIDTGFLALTKVGTGVQILTGTNIYTGATTISAGTLQLGDGVGTNQVLPVAAAITNNGTLAINTAGTPVMSGIISGTGGITKSGTGACQLSGVNTYTGPTEVTAGTLHLNYAARAGANTLNATTFTVTAPGVLQLASTNTTIDALYNAGGTNFNASTGTINKTGTGYVTWYQGTRILTGTINIQGGCLGSNGTAWTGSSAAVNISAGAFLDLRVAQTTNAVRIGALSGAGTVGTTFSGANNILEVGNGNATSTFSGAIVNGITAFPGFAAGGTLALTKVGTGSLILTGANTLTGTITISGGILQLGDGVTTGTILPLGAAIVNNGLLYINTAGTSVRTGVISGTGGLSKGGAGGLTLSGANTFSGTGGFNGTGTVVSANATALGNGGGVALNSPCVLTFTVNHTGTKTVVVNTGSTVNKGGFAHPGITFTNAGGTINP